MTSEGKWIDGLTPNLAPVEAARLVLSARLDAVKRWLPLAARESERDPEHVHQLRVSTRRADAALKLFRACLPKSVYREWRDRLRQLRRTAGAARDADVFLHDVRERAEAANEIERPAFDFLIGHVMGVRAAARPALEALPVEGVTDSIPGLLAALLAPSEEKILDIARPALKGLIDDFDQSLEGNLKDFEHLHQVRIQGKRLRYAVEVFAGCFDARLREEVYLLIEQMQETLGRANDSYFTAGRLSALKKAMVSWGEVHERVKPGLVALLRTHQHRLNQERKRFGKWIDSWRKVHAREAIS